MSDDNVIRDLFAIDASSGKTKSVVASAVDAEITDTEMRTRGQIKPLRPQAARQQKEIIRRCSTDALVVVLLLLTVTLIVWTMFWVMPPGLGVLDAGTIKLLLGASALHFALFALVPMLLMVRLEKLKFDKI